MRARAVSIILHLSAAILASFSAAPAQATELWRDVYVCGKSESVSFYFGNEGWATDGISGGVVVLRRFGSRYDIFFKDAVASFSAIEDGATVTGRQENGVIQVLAVYPALTIETFLFSAPKDGKVKLA